MCSSSTRSWIHNPKDSGLPTSIGRDTSHLCHILPWKYPESDLINFYLTVKLVAQQTCYKKETDMLKELTSNQALSQLSLLMHKPLLRLLAFLDIAWLGFSVPKREDFSVHTYSPRHKTHAHTIILFAHAYTAEKNDEFSPFQMLSQMQQPFQGQKYHDQSLGCRQYNLNIHIKFTIRTFEGNKLSTRSSVFKVN